ETLVSIEDLPKLESYDGTWYGRKTPNSRIYVQGYYKSGSIQLHRYLLDYPNGLVDHKNHNELDNTRGNLRVVDRYINAQNRRGAASNNKSSGIRGITWSKNEDKWQVRIQLYGKRYQLGYYKELDEAIQALKNFKMEKKL